MQQINQDSLFCAASSRRFVSFYKDFSAACAAKEKKHENDISGQGKAAANIQIQAGVGPLRCVKTLVVPIDPVRGYRHYQIDYGSMWDLVMFASLSPSFWYWYF